MGGWRQFGKAEGRVGSPPASGMISQTRNKLRLPAASLATVQEPRSGLHATWRHLQPSWCFWAENLLGPGGLPRLCLSTEQSSFGPPPKRNTKWWLSFWFPPNPTQNWYAQKSTHTHTNPLDMGGPDTGECSCEASPALPRPGAHRQGVIWTCINTRIPECLRKVRVRSFFCHLEKGSRLTHS